MGSDPMAGVTASDASVARLAIAAVLVALGGCTGAIEASDDREDSVGSAGATGAGAAAIGTTGTIGTTGNGGIADGAQVQFAPAPGAYRRLTNAAFRNSLRDLLGGPVDVHDLEPDSWAVGGLPTVGAAEVSISPLGVEQYQSAIDAATAQVFADTARRDKVLGCKPQSETDMACFQTFVTSFGRLAFRQPLTTAQVDRYVQLIASVAATLGDAYEGMRAAMIGLLLSPNFLYRLERGAPSPTGGDGFWQYTSREMASRLAYFLTNSTPDTTLLDLADQDALQTPDAIRAQAQRLLETTAGRQSVGNFASELFQLQIIAARAKDATMFPEYTPALQTAMIEEIPAMFEALVFDRDASALELFTTRDTLVTTELAAVYGLPATGLSSTTLKPATLPADGLRAGLLGTAGFLSLYASQKEGSPTLRGKFIREILLCQTIPPPPPNVNTMLEDPPPGVVLTRREKLTQHESNPGCASCHTLMDPLGLTLENFDAIGKFRATDHGKDIDVSGDLDGTSFDGPIELGQLLAKQPAVAACMVRNIYRYGTGHVETPTEAPVLSDLTAHFEAGGYHLKDLMLELVSSDGFRFVAPAAP
jgi:hypothetical protein